MPTWTRFISADSVVNKNSYWYCNNGPVNMCDYAGKEPYQLFDRLFDLLEDFERLYNNLSDEYGSWIMQDRETGKYCYRTPTKSNKSLDGLNGAAHTLENIEFLTQEEFCEYEPIATVHTHGSFNGDIGVFLPSPEDAKSTYELNSTGNIIYVITPDRSIYKLHVPQKTTGLYMIDVMMEPIVTSYALDHPPVGGYSYIDYSDFLHNYFSELYNVE